MWKMHVNATKFYHENIPICLILDKQLSYFACPGQLHAYQSLFFTWVQQPSIGMQFCRSQICNGALMRVHDISNSVKRNDEKNTVNSWHLG